MIDLSKIRFDDKGLVPAIAQDAVTGQVLMQAYMNREALEKTLETRQATYFSRSRQVLWRKGEISGHTQRVVAMACDCDGDALLLQVIQTGPACHTGQRSCFFNALMEGERPATSQVLEEVYTVIADRDENPKEGSYTNYLLKKGVEKIAKKVGEEAAETIIAAIKGDGGELRYEAADLLYHLMVLLYNQGVAPGEVWQELRDRR